MNRQLESTLVEALDLLEKGVPVVRILSTYPEMADELRPYLQTAADLNQLAEPAPAAAQQASKRQFLQEAAALQGERRPPAAAWLRQILVYGLAAMLFLFMGSAMLAFTAGEALPGDTLYGAKLFLETVRINYSANPASAAVMIENFRQERVEEVAALLASGRQEQVTFSGAIETLALEKWTVEGLPVMITSATLISDAVEVGFVVRVSGMTADGAVVAAEVELLNGRLPEADPVEPPPPLKPSPSPTPTDMPTNTPERPDILQPDSESESAPPILVPAPTITSDDNVPGGDDVEQGEGGSLESPPAGEDGDAQSGEDASEDSYDDQAGDSSPEEGGSDESSDKEANEDTEDKEDTASEDGGDEKKSEEDKSVEDDGGEDVGSEQKGD